MSLLKLASVWGSVGPLCIFREDEIPSLKNASVCIVCG